jgi:hypothetical protein
MSHRTPDPPGNDRAHPQPREVAHAASMPASRQKGPGGPRGGMPSRSTAGARAARAATLRGRLLRRAAAENNVLSHDTTAREPGEHSVAADAENAALGGYPEATVGPDETAARDELEQRAGRER